MKKETCIRDSSASPTDYILSTGRNNLYLTLTNEKRDQSFIYCPPSKNCIYDIFTCHLIEHSPGAQMGCHKTAMESLTHAHLIGPWLA